MFIIKDLFLILLFLLSGPFLLIAGNEESSFPKQEKLVVYADKNFPPFEFLDKDGNPSGLNVELFNTVMSKINLDYELYFADWDEIIERFEAGEVDVIIGISNLPERSKKMGFCIPHNEISLEIISKKERPIQTIADLRDKRIIVQRRDWAHDYLTEHPVSDQLVFVRNAEEGMEKLENGIGDAFLCSDLVIYYHQMRYKLQDYSIHEADIASVPYSIAVRKSNERLLYLLNKGLYELKAEGVLEGLYNKWLGIYEPSRAKKMLCLFICLLLVVGSVLGTFIFILRRQISKATHNLRKSQLRLKERNTQLQIALKAGSITPLVWEIQPDILHISLDDVDSFSELEPFKESVPLETLFRYIHSDDIPTAKEMFARIGSGEATSSHTTIRYYNSGQFKGYYDLHLMLQTSDKDGNPQIAIGYSQDITIRKQAELELEEAKERAERSDRFKTAFMANMSHEIRTPLNSIVGFTQLMRSAQNEEEKEFYENIINENSTLLSKLINDVLDLSKIEAGFVELINKSFYVNEFMDEVASMYAMRMRPGVEFILEKPESNCFIEFDKERLTQIISNFMTNAIKFTPHGSIRLGYYVHHEGIVMYVADTGIGIKKENQQKIFDRFEKINTFIQGSGIGLSICKSIVEGAGGYIRVFSEEGNGSRFEVYIPCSPEIVSAKDLEMHSKKAVFS